MNKIDFDGNTEQADVKMFKICVYLYDTSLVFGECVVFIPQAFIENTNLFKFHQIRWSGVLDHAVFQQFMSGILFYFESSDTKNILDRSSPGN